MRRFDRLILSTSLLGLMASPAFGQSAAPVDATDEKQQDAVSISKADSTDAQAQSTNEGAIVVTGSRIRRNNFNTPQNIDIITRDDLILAGTRSTAETLQSAAVTSGTAQINGSFLGFLSDNGQAASTVGLRGLGSARTLILLNGRRLAPAGVGPQLVAADLNVLPTAMVQRIEVLREGASSIYGSDAIAGVINIITDTSIDGIVLDGFADVPVYAKGDGQTYRASVTAGKKFDGGHITASFEYRQDNGLRYGSRPDTRCPRELAYDSSNQLVGQPIPGTTTPRCFPYERNAGAGVAAGYGVGFSFNGAPGSRLALANYTTNPTLFGPPVNVAPGNSYDLRPESRQDVLRQTILSPIKTLTGYVNGSFSPGLGDAELYGEALFTRRLSRQEGLDRPDWQSIDNHDTTAQFWGGNYAGTPLEVYGYPVSPFFPVAWANAGYNYFGPFISPNRLFFQKQKVDYFRANGGLRGGLGIGDWRYDANVQISRTKSRYDLQTPLTANMGNVMVAVLAPSGTPGQYTTTALPGQVGAGKTYTCASNLTNGTYNGGTCVPLNFFDPDILNRGNLSPALYDYLYPTVNYTKTKFHQETFSLGLDGSLFRLPAGEVKAALGFEHRHDHIADTPGTERAAGLLYYFGTAGDTIGSDTVNEAYAEVNIPILKEKPFFHSLELDASGRYTHYKSYGSGWTYHVSGQWSPVEPLRLRANYGTNFRAPNLYEQYIADEIGFYSNGLDPCANFAANYAPGDTVYKNCLAELTPIRGADAVNFNPPGGSFQVTNSGGKGVLEAEHARTWGAGAIFTMPRSIADFSLAIDYWHIKVTGEVNTLGNHILDFCYEAEDYPNNPYCQFIDGRLTLSEVTSPEQAGIISNLRNPFVNISQQIASGIDLDARYATRLLGGRFQAQVQVTRNLEQKLEVFQGQGLVEYNGTLGYPGQNGGPKWVGNADLRFTTADNITFHWGIEFVGKSNSQDLDPGLTINPCAVNLKSCPTPIHYDLTAESYWEHGASVQFQWPKVGQVTMGVNNIFNAKPPRISDVPAVGYPVFGNYFLGGPYDYRGRSVFINLTASF